MRQIGKVALNVTNRSGFDKSHRNLFTGKVGTLYPILTEEVLPNSTIHLSEAISAKLPPLASDTFMNVQLKTEAFFVPFRLLYGGFEDWLMETPLRTPSGLTYNLKCPVLNVDSATSGSLIDFLGWKNNGTLGSIDENINIFPFLAYHRIYDDWYRNSRIQSPLFTKAGNLPGSTSSGDNYIYMSVANLPFVSISDQTVTGGSSSNNVFDGTKTIPGTSPFCSGFFADGSYITDLRQRNFGLDYFTSAQPSAQLRNARSVVFEVNGTPVSVVDGDSREVETFEYNSGLQGSFTISSLRAQNSLQQFCERNNFSFRASDYYYINYGSRLRSGLAQRAIFLGQQNLDVYTKTIAQSQFSSETQSVGSRNPFESVGAQYGNAYIQGSDNLIGDFTADEPGILMVMASLVPKVTYNTGMRRYFKHFVKPGSQTDLANAILQNVGNQPIHKYELTGDPIDTAVFGYTDRYAEWMDHPDEIHGLLKDGEMLESFALQRSFASSSPELNGSFLEIPTDYLDQVAAVSVGVSGFNYWAEVYFNFKVVQPLNEYSIPSLQDPAYEHGHKIVVNKNGGSL